jgi:hypothetical protein
MHAVVASVNIASGQFDGARNALREEIVPRIKQAPGLVKGYWTTSADKTQGTSCVVFDTKEHADAAAQMARTGKMPPGVTFVSIDVREVTAET